MITFIIILTLCFVFSVLSGEDFFIDALLGLFIGCAGAFLITLIFTATATRTHIITKTITSVDSVIYLDNINIENSEYTNQETHILTVVDSCVHSDFLFDDVRTTQTLMIKACD